MSKSANQRPGWLIVLAVGVVLWGTAPWAPAGPPDAAPKDPELYIPRCPAPPKIDGALSPGEWKYAAAVSMLEDVRGVGMNRQQPVFYVFRDADNLYVAMVSTESSAEAIVAQTTTHDHMSIIGDDCMELMIAPGSGDEIKAFSFPVFYWAINAVGTVWDARFVPALAEAHNSWESGIEQASTVAGARWTIEARVPLKSIVQNPPKDGRTWRMNFDRTYFGYQWSAWCGKGGLNQAQVGGDVTFDSRAAAVRLLDVKALRDGKLRIGMEVANATREAQTVKVSLRCFGRRRKGGDLKSVAAEDKQVTVRPQQAVRVTLGTHQELLAHNYVEIQALDQRGKRLFYLKRYVPVPLPELKKLEAPKTPPVYVFPRFLPSLDRLTVIVNYKAWAKGTERKTEGVQAHVRVFAKGGEQGAPVLEGKLTEFKDYEGRLRLSTKALPEGEYTVNVRVADPRGDLLVEHDDWFVKKVFDWMTRPPDTGQDVPSYYTPLETAKDEVRPWGRTYRFAPTGLPAAIVTQGRRVVHKQVQLLAEIGGKTAELKIAKPFAFTRVRPGEVRGRSVLTVGDLKIELEAITEYDGFLLYRLTYGPASGEVKLDRLRVRIPMAGKYCKFYSAAGDTQGTFVLGDVLPAGQGKIFDSLNNTRSACCSPTFASLLWVADHDVCFCYAADSDKGWLIRDDAPAVELHREGEDLVMWLNLVDKPWKLTAPRTLEFAFQAGPVRPRPKGWRGIQHEGDPGDAPQTLHQIGGSGHTLSGGTHFIHPGHTPELVAKSRRRIEQTGQGGTCTIVGYHYWATVPKGFDETRVFRGEWGVDKATWDGLKTPRKWEWDNQFYGPDKDRYIITYVRPVPSLVSFITSALDAAMRQTQLAGHYDDTGYPKPIYDEELGLGFVREDGRKVWSSGLWTYRRRWKLAEQVMSRNRRPNFLMDSQHVHAHFLPAYGPIGIWAPCEHGFYNPFADRDNLGFYRSIERYAAINPAKQFGQIPMVGMGTPQHRIDLQVRDTRCMMMLAMLHDHDVGSFGQRDRWTVCRLRHARNRFRPWTEDVAFLGYWESGDRVRCDSPDLRVSAYHRPGEAALIVGNVGDGTAKATIEPDWKRFGLDPADVELFDAETDERVAVAAGTSKRAFRIEVPSHDVRVLIAAARGRYAVSPLKLGAGLPRPEQVLKKLSDPLTGPKLDAAWKTEMHEGTAGAYFLEGRLCLQSAHYGYGHVRRKLGVDNVSVQCLILRRPSGGMDESGGSLFLHWANGSYLQATPGVGRGSFLYSVSGRTYTGSAVSRRSVPGWYPYCANWVKIVLGPETIEFHGSADGKAWKKDFSIQRDKLLAGPPDWLVLGNGQRGDKPLLMNVISQHFRPTGGNPVTFYSDLIVGKD